MSILTAFNNHFEEFLGDIVRVFPDDMDIPIKKRLDDIFSTE